MKSLQKSVLAEEQMYFEAGKVLGLGICGKGMVSSYSGAFDAPEVFSHRSYKSQYLAQKESKFSYLVFSSTTSDTIR